MGAAMPRSAVGDDTGRGAHGPLETDPGRPRRGRPPTLSRSRIVQAGVAVVRAEGFGALSIRRLGEELNAGATSIYGHVRDKGHLCDLVVDELVGAIQVPDRGRPERRLVKFAESARSVMGAHPGMAELLMQRGGTGPNAIRLAERVLAALVAAGVGESRLMDAYHSILAYVNGFTVASGLSRTGDPDDLAARRADAQAHLAGADPAQIPTLRAALAHRPLDDDARFRFGMNAILAGLHDSRPSRPDAPADKP